MIEKGVNPVIIANTNCESWEMQPYVKMSIAANYTVEFVEPTTPWRFKPKELAKFITSSIIFVYWVLLLHARPLGLYVVYVRYSNYESC